MLGRARIVVGSLVTALVLVAGMLVVGPRCVQAEDGQVCCKPVIGGECCTSDTGKCCEAGFKSCKITLCEPE